MRAKKAVWGHVFGSPEVAKAMIPKGKLVTSGLYGAMSFVTTFCVKREGRCGLR